MNALAPAPEYRALMLFDRLPAGCISFQCKDVSSSARSMVDAHMPRSFVGLVGFVGRGKGHLSRPIAL